MEKLELKDFLKYKYLSNLEFSPNGKTACFVATEADYEDNSYKSNIWIMKAEDKSYKKLTSLNKEKSFFWLDDNRVVFPSNRDEKIKKAIEDGEKWTIYYAIDITGGEACEFMRIPMAVTSIKSIDEDNYVLTAEFDNNGIDLHALCGEEKQKAIATIKDNKDYEVLDEIPFWSNGGGFTNKKRNRMYLYNKSTNKATAITDEFTNVESVDYKDGKIVYIASRFTDKMTTYNTLQVYDVKTKTNTVLIEDNKYSIGFAYAMEGGVILSLTDMKDYGLNQNQDIYFLKDGELKLITYHDTGLRNSVGSDCRYGGGKSVKVVGDKLYFISTIMHGAFLNRLSLDGSLEILTEDNGSVDCFDVSSNGEIFFVGLKDFKLQELYSLKGEEEACLTAFNEEIHSTKSIAKPEYFTFASEDDVEIEGFVIKPVDFDPNKTYPGILDIHGGPKTVYGNVFYHEMQVWANMGYIVLFCNPHGGDGRGNEFADIRGKYGTIDYNDLMTFTDKVIKRYPQLDSDRIGVTGGSYGGYMTNWIIGHTDRFKCAASQRSIANWISKFGTTDIGYYFNSDQNASTPWENHDKMWWHSPMRYADKAKTPTLFIHSEQDYRCWLAEGLQMFTSLKYHGVEARLCMFRGENHELSRSGKPKHRVRRLEEMTNWFEKYLK